MPGTKPKPKRPPVRTPNPLHRRDYVRLRALLLGWRKSADLSQRALAEKLGRSLAWVNRCETGGRRMDPLEWLDWLETCGIDPTTAVRDLRKR